jgi:chemotaxis protein methyltransferase CheR
MTESGPSAEVAELAEWVRLRTGLVFPPARREPAIAALARSLAEDGGVARTIARLERDEGALDELLADLTIGESYFFRHAEQLGVVRSRILPELTRHRRTPLRVWSAGCATGEEPYSLAILLREAEPGVGARVLGTDLSRTRLRVAQRGRYRAWSLRGVAAPTIARYFRRLGEWYELSAEIRAAVDFRPLNLVGDRYPSATSGIWGMDLILCRNVLIYLDRTAVREVVSRLVASLADGGWLLLGASDPLIADLAPVDVEVTEAGLAYRRASAARSRARTRPAPGPAAPPAAESPPPEPVPSPAPRQPSRPDRTRPSPPPRGGPTIDDLRRLYAERRYDAVEEGARSLLDRGIRDEAGQLLLVRALANQGRIPEAGRASAAALEEHPDSAELLYLHALLLLQVDRAEEAALAARRALYLDRRLVVAHLALADASVRSGRNENARRSLRNARRLLAPMDPDQPVEASDGETAERLRAIVELRLQLLERNDSPDG